MTATDQASNVTALMPHDLAAETALLGWCLLSPLDAHRVLDRLSPDECYRPAHQEAFELLRGGHVPEAELIARTDLTALDVNAAIKAAPYAHEVDRLVDWVAELATRRRLIVAADETVRAARDLSADVAQASRALQAVTDDLDVAAGSVVTYGEFMAVDDGAPDWVIPNLLERSDRLLLTAAEGVGKSVMLRQIAVASAAGLHPWRLSRMTPLRVLLVDVENKDRQIRRHFAQLDRAVNRDAPGWDQTNLAIAVKVGGLDLLRSSDRRWLSEHIAGHRPDLLVIGPLYQLHGAAPRGDVGGENHARELARTLDRLRERFGCALVMETHAPHGSVNAVSRDLRPFGSSVWLRWPEFGVGLQRNRELGERAYELKPWRGPRDTRDWPIKFEQGMNWPWIATYRTAEHRDEENW